MTTSSRLSACSDWSGVEHAPPRHQFRGHVADTGAAAPDRRSRQGSAARRPRARTCRWRPRCAAIRGRSPHCLRRSFRAPQMRTPRRSVLWSRPRECGTRGRQRRVVIQHEDADVLGFAHMPADAPRPVPQPQAPQGGRQEPGRPAALRRPLVQFGSEPGSDRLVDAADDSAALRVRRIDRWA